MNLDRFTILVESYGADPARWPDDERHSALEFSRQSADAQAALNQADQLDQQLALFDLPDDESLPARIENSLFSQFRPTWLERLLNWLLPDFDNFARTVWRPILAACMPLLIGILIGTNVADNETYELTSAEELNLLAMTEFNTEDWKYD